MKDLQEIRKRYYRAETTLEEEAELKEMYQNGLLPEDPALSLRPLSRMPEGLEERIRAGIRERKRKKLRQIGYTTAGIAATLILILTLRIPLISAHSKQLQLSDNIKRERFEEALRTIGEVLKEKTPSQERILYEDKDVIIAIE